MNKYLLVYLLLLSLFINNNISGQNKFAGSSFPQNSFNSFLINEGFESVNFPPQGWQRRSVIGYAVWERTTDFYHSGIASAYITYQSSGGEDWLITPRIYINNTDSISFWIKKQFTGAFPPDSLIVKASVTDSALASFQHTLIRIDVAYLPGNTWVKYSASLSAIAENYVYIGFQHKDFNGNGCYLDDILITGTGIVGIDEKENNVPVEFMLYQNYPNPFNPQTKIKFALPKAALVSIKVFDVSGREVMKLIDREMKPGIYESSFDASQLSSGIYFYSLYINNDIIDTKKMVVGK